MTDTTTGSPVTTVYTNNDLGFPMNDAVIAIPSLSCFDDENNGLFNLTVGVSETGRSDLSYSLLANLPY